MLSNSICNYVMTSFDSGFDVACAWKIIEYYWKLGILNFDEIFFYWGILSQIFVHNYENDLSS